MSAAGMRSGGKGDDEELPFRTMVVGDEGGVGVRPWRLNFDGFRRPGAEQEKPARGLQGCLGVLGL